MSLKLTVLISLLSFSTLFGHDFFRITDESKFDTQVRNDRNIIPERYATTELNFEAMTAFLMHKVPSERSNKNNGKYAVLSIPNPKGEMVKFHVYETQMMENGLAAKYSEIKTFKGYNPSDPREKIHFGISMKGFYASSSSPEGSYYIDLYSKESKSHYLSYFTRDHTEEEGINQTCGTENNESPMDQLATYSARNLGEILPLRTYRFALACTGEFAAFFGPTKAEVLAEFVKSVNRINQITENDLAIRLLLVDNTDNVIFTDKDTDPYPEGLSGGSLLGQNTNILNMNIGFANYDIGHIYTRGCNDTGGIAFIRSACAGNKGGGVTCHSSGDITAVAVRVAAHEVGHQLGSNHTFNNCNGNENGGTAYEPGSGSTIMSYGGLCGSALNLVSVSSDYYHVSSIIEITNYTRNGLGDNCPTLLETSNNIPVVSIPMQGGFSIPISTPFELTGAASDEDGDALTYSWEQYDLGPSSVLGAPQANSPLFMSQYPSEDPTRIFPTIETIISNEQDVRETLPTYSRDLTFQFIARDNNEESGGVAWTDIEFQSDASAGPFLVEFPNGGDVFEVGEEIEIVWDVANTDNEIIDCKSVDIYLSTNGGITFDFLLLENTANDGLAEVFLPNKISNDVRIKIKARDNIFFDISNEDFEIQEPTQAGFVFSYSPGYVEHCVPDDILIDFTAQGLLGYDKAIRLEVESGLIDGMSVAFDKEEILPGEGTSATISFENSSVSGEVLLTISASNEDDTLYREIVLDLIGTDFSDIKSVFPVNGSSGVNVSPVLQWTADSDADSYIVKLSDNPSFNESESEIFYLETTTDTFFELDDILSKNQVYYWTVEGTNICTIKSDEAINTFATEAISCNTYAYNDLPAPISQSAVLTVEMPIEVNSLGQVTDVNILKLRGAHQWVSELRAELISPVGTSVLLFNKKCLGQSDFNCGFDVDATTEITCPLNQGIFYKPEESLDTFNGEDISGLWLFKLTDNAVGNGGSVQEYTLELCSNVSLASPFIVNNNVMPLPSGVGRRLGSEFLLSEDENNSGEELIYTIVTLPSNGLMRFDEDSIHVGSQFTQKDLDDMRIRYLHNGESTSDSFVFVVQDGEGGWIDKTTFNISIDNDITLDVDETIGHDLQVFPNPNGGNFNVRISDDPGDLRFELFNISGQRIALNQDGALGAYSFSMNQKTEGIYFLVVTGDQYTAVQKIFIQP